MNNKTGLGFLLVLTVFILGALAIYNSFRVIVNAPQASNAIETDEGNEMKLPKLDVGFYPNAAPIASATWLNSPKLNWDDLRGKVVLVEFWTFG